MALSEPEKSANKKNAKNSLEKAVRLDGSFLPPVYMLVDLLMEEKGYEKCIEMYVCWWIVECPRY